MRKSFTRLLASVVLLLLPVLAFPQVILLQAVTDFENIESGVVPYYRDLAGGRDVLAINAGIEDYREKFARADHVFDGPEGLYDITLNAMGEIDGDGDYHLLLDGVIVGQVANPPVIIDFQIVQHTFTDINLVTGSVISVESNAVSNNTIPEGNAFAFARGRWRSLELDPQTIATPPADNSVDLEIIALISDSSPVEGDSIEISFEVFNRSSVNTATAPVVTLHLPGTLRFVSSADCSSSQDTVSCALVEIAPGSSVSVKVSAEVLSSGEEELEASVAADQNDSNLADNNAALTVSAQDKDPVVDEPPVDETPVDETPVDESGDNSDQGVTPDVSPQNSPAVTSSGGGALSSWWLALLLAGYTRRNGRRACRSMVATSSQQCCRAHP